MTRALAATFVMLCLLGACDESTDGDPEGVTRAEFTARVDAICADRSDAVEGLEPPDNIEESVRVLRRVLPVIRDQVNRIRELGEPPAEGAEHYLDWFEARDALVETTADMIEAAEQRDVAHFQELAALQQRLDERADAAAAAYGFEVCGKSPAEDLSEDAS